MDGIGAVPSKASVEHCLVGHPAMFSFIPDV
jgi:hypothetical protein